MLAELWSDLRYRARALVSHGRMEHDLDDELRFHLEREAEKNMRAGVSAGEAMRQARIAFGGVDVAKEESRDGRGIALIEGIRRDLDYAWRSLTRSPGFTIAVVLTLGLGIGANAAMFNIVDRLLFRTPAYLREPDRVHRVYLAWKDRGEEKMGRSTEYTRYLDLKQGSTVFDQMAGYTTRELPVGLGTETREMPVATMSAELFDFFDAVPVLGRFFTASEDTVPMGAPVAVLGYRYWQTDFGGRADVLGQHLEVGTADYTIIGVAPRDFVGIPDNGTPAVFIPITTFAGAFRGGTAQANYYTSYNWGWMRVVARRKPGVSLEAANADLSRAYLQSWNKEVGTSSGRPASVTHPHAIAGPVQDERGPMQSQVTKVASSVTAVAGIVLLIACANVANLFLARAIRRRREIAVRLALGVGKSRLAMQLLTECLLLAVTGGLAGLAIAYWGGAFFQKLFIPDGMVPGAPFDTRTLLFALAVAVLAGVVTGMAPVLQARRTDLVESLKAGIREGGQRRSPLRSGLLLVQAALSVVLLVGAGLFVQSLRNVQAMRLGYDVDPVLYVYPNMRGAKLSDDENTVLRRQLVEAARAIPGVESASRGLTLPLWDTWVQGLFVTGIDSVARLGEFTLQGVDPEYFHTVGTRILRGRGITSDDRKNAPLVAVVTESMARALWPGKDALGQCMRMNADTMPCITIVGISEDIRQNSLTDDAKQHYFLPIEQFQPAAAVGFVRVHGDGRQMKEVVRRALQPLMPGDSYVSVTPMRDVVDPNIASWRLGATMFLAFGGLALLLATIGLYSVIAYDVAQRTNELGIRIALGAGIGDVVRLVVGGGLRVALLGVAIGGSLALWAGPRIEPLLFNQPSRDPLIFGVVTCTLIAVAVLACALPALRATRVNPTVALKAE